MKRKLGKLRSLIFIPGNNKRFLEKSKSINADIVCFDLEDSVPLEEKESARELIRKTIQEFNELGLKRNLVAVRINAPDSNQYKKDLDNIIMQGLDLIVIPKVSTSDEVIEISKKIADLETQNNISKDQIKIIPSIESAIGVVNAFSIAKSDERVVSLVFGIFDFLHDMKIDNPDPELLLSNIYARSKIPVDARAAGIDSIDAIWQDINDTDGLLRDLKLGKRLGYNGKCIIHPSQIENVHKIFQPSSHDIEWAKKVILALDNAYQIESNRKGAIKLEGKMIDAVHYKQAKRIIETLQ